MTRFSKIETVIPPVPKSKANCLLGFARSLTALHSPFAWRSNDPIIDFGLSRSLPEKILNCHRHIDAAGTTPEQMSHNGPTDGHTSGAVEDEPPSIRPAPIVPLVPLPKVGTESFVGSRNPSPLSPGPPACRRRRPAECGQVSGFRIRGIGRDWRGSQWGRVRRASRRRSGGVIGLWLLKAASVRLPPSPSGKRIFEPTRRAEGMSRSEKLSKPE